MHKKLTITIDEEVYKNLYLYIGQRKISHFIESLIRAHVINKNLELAYQEMALDQQREAEADDWSEGVLGDINHA